MRLSNKKAHFLIESRTSYKDYHNEIIRQSLCLRCPVTFRSYEDLFRFFRPYRHYFRPFTILTRHFVTNLAKYHLARNEFFIYLCRAVGFLIRAQEDNDC